MEPYEDDSLGKGTVRLGKLEDVSRAIRATIDGEQMHWGTQCVAKIVNPERSMVRSAGYLSKLVNYTCKDLEKDLGQEVTHSPEATKHHKQLNAAARREHCGIEPSVDAEDFTNANVRWLLCEVAHQKRDDFQRGCKGQLHRA